MKLNDLDKEVIKSMPKAEISAIMDEWVAGTHSYTKNDRDWSPLVVMSKHFGEGDTKIKSIILKRAHELAGKHQT